MHKRFPSFDKIENNHLFNNSMEFLKNLMPYNKVIIKWLINVFLIKNLCIAVVSMAAIISPHHIYSCRIRLYQRIECAMHLLYKSFFYLSVSLLLSIWQYTVESINIFKIFEIYHQRIISFCFLSSQPHTIQISPVHYITLHIYA